MAEESEIRRLAWRVKELAKYTGYSMRHIRYEITAGRLIARNDGPGTATIILDEDARAWLKNKKVFTPRGNKGDEGDEAA